MISVLISYSPDLYAKLSDPLIKNIIMIILLA